MTYHALSMNIACADMVVCNAPTPEDREIALQGARRARRAMLNYLRRR